MRRLRLVLIAPASAAGSGRSSVRKLAARFVLLATVIGALTGSLLAGQASGAPAAELGSLLGTGGPCDEGERVFHDDFDAYTSKLTVTELGSVWSAGATNVDVIGPGLFDLVPGNGNYVDMVGTNGNAIGHLITTQAFPAGEYCLRVWVAGNHRNTEPDTVELRFGGLSRVATRGRSDGFLVEDLVVTTGAPSSIELVAGDVGSRVIGLIVGEVELIRLATTPPSAGSPPEATDPGATPPAPSIPIPDSGESVKVAETLGATTKEVAVTVTGSLDDVSFTGLALTEKARRLRNLRRTRDRLETNCGLTLANGRAFARSGLTVLEEQVGIAVACERLLREVQQRLDELESQRAAAQHRGGERSCQTVSLRVRSEIRNGRRVTRVVEKGLKPRITLRCRTTETGLELTIRRRGQGTLRSVIGSKLTLTIRRSDAAPPPSSGATLTIGFAQR